MPLTNLGNAPLWLNAIVFAAAAAFVWLAGTKLSRYIGAISETKNLEQAVTGMLFLGTLTSLPEIANVVTAGYIGNPALAVNNLLGSASINVVLLAIADAVFNRNALTSIVAKPSALVQAALCMLVLALVAIAVSSGDVQVLGIGAWSLALCVVGVAAFVFSARYGPRAAWMLSEPLPDRRRGAQAERADGGAKASVGSLALRSAVAAAVILAAGYTLAQSGDAIAQQTGLGSGLVGFLLLGFSTSLPEASTITGALRAGREDMALGEVLGTNFVNIALILLADAVFTGGPVINELGSFEVISSLLGLILTGTYLIGLLEHRDRVFLRMGYDSLAVMALFAGGVALLFTVR